MTENDWLSIAMDDIGKNPGKNMPACFLVLLPEIKLLLDKKITIKKVWQTFHEKGSFPGNYNTFRLYTKKYIPDAKEIGVSTASSEASVPQNSASVTPVNDASRDRDALIKRMAHIGSNSNTPKEDNGGFVHDPTSYTMEEVMSMPWKHRKKEIQNG